MKRAGRILSLVIVTIMLCTAVCFADSAAAGSFNLVEAYPKDGATGTAMENVGVKLYFDTEFSEKVLKNKNDKAFQLVDPEGKSLPLMVLYVPKEDVKEEGVKGIILVLLDNTGDHSDVKVESNTEYTLKISKELVADNGSTLGTDQSVTFRTMNQQANTLINILMMVVMYGGIMFFTMRSMKKTAKEEAERAKEEKVNPYKEAKRTGKSVEEIVEKDQRDKAKRAAKRAKMAEGAEDDDDYEEDNGNYRVKAPRPISAAGAKYKTGRKALAEAKKAEEEARAARRKAQSKGKKK